MNRQYVDRLCLKVNEFMRLFSVFQIRVIQLKLRSSKSSVQMAAANHVGAAVLVHVARSGRLDDVIDERSLGGGII